MSQATDVIEFIRDNGSITTMDAFRYLGITRLASRINELRKHGIPVESKMVSVIARNGRVARVARYTIPGGVPDCFMP